MATNLAALQSQPAPKIRYSRRLQCRVLETSASRAVITVSAMMILVGVSST
jgi:hypothetical protein